MQLPNTLLRSLRIPEQRLVVIQPTDRIDLEAIGTAVLFVLARWAIASLVSFRALNRALQDAVGSGQLRLHVADTDDQHTEEFIIRNGDVPSGGGETYWIKNGRIVAKMANYDRSSN